MAAFEFAHHYSPLNIRLSVWAGNLLVFAVVLVGAYFFSGFVFGIIERVQRELIQRTQELAQRTAVAEALYEISTEISAALEVDHVVQSVASSAQRLLKADLAAVGLVEQTPHQLRWRVARSANPSPDGGLPEEAGPALIERLRCTRQPLIWEHPLPDAPPSDPPGEAFHRLGMGAVLAAPVWAGDRFAGALLVASRQPAPFGPNEAALVAGLATQAAIAVEKARLIEQVQNLAAVEERERIAREMHDGVAQVLGYVGIKAQAVRELVKTGRLDDALAQLDQLAAASQEVYADLREAILGLRTSTAFGRPLVEALREYLERFSGHSGVEVFLEVPEAASPNLRPAAEFQLLRIIQEALTNVRKHAQARRAWVRFAPRGACWQVEVEDDGAGLGSARHPLGGPRFGLQMMRERAESIGGSFAIERRPGGGTRVVVTIPAQNEVVAHADRAG